MGTGSAWVDIVAQLVTQAKEIWLLSVRFWGRRVEDEF